MRWSRIPAALVGLVGCRDELRMGLVALVAASLAAGCQPNRIKGTVGGEAITVRSAMFSEHPEAFGQDGLVFVVLSELPNACGAYSNYQQAASRTTDPAALADLWANTFPPEFWEVMLVLRVADPELPLTDLQVPGLEWYELLELRNYFFVRFTRNHALRDEAWFTGEGETEDYLDEFLSHQGVLRVDEHVPGVRFKGVSEALVVDTETVELQGLVRVHFDASPCPGVIGL